MNYVIVPTSKDITHHGILGQKWGKRQGPPYPLDGSDHSAAEQKAGWKKSLNKERNAVSVKAAANKALAKVYGLNEKVYKKSNPTLASMNSAAKSDALKRADKAQKEANLKRSNKIAEKEKYLKVNPDDAKNKQTRRVALDYNNMTDSQFKGKYHTSKEKFAKRYAKSKGDTYSMGLKKAAIATAITAMAPQPYNSVHGTVKVGKAAAAKYLAMDLGASVIKTNFGYNKAEAEYAKSKK